MRETHSRGESLWALHSFITSRDTETLSPNQTGGTLLECDKAGVQFMSAEHAQLCTEMSEDESLLETQDEAFEPCVKLAPE